MTNRTRIILIVATISILSIMTGAKKAGEVDHNESHEDIGTATSTTLSPIQQIPEKDLEISKPIAQVDPEDRAAKIDRYFEKRGMPLAGRGPEFVSAADLYGIEWNLLAAISVVESTGGKAACGNNPFGWGSCRPGVGSFGSISEAIDYVSKNLGGQNPRTRGAYAGGIDADLHSYNGAVEPGYPKKVKDIMSEISRTPLSPTE